MDVGTELDRLVHEHVMGECPCIYEPVTNIEDYIEDEDERFFLVGAGLQLFECPRCKHRWREDFHKERVFKPIPSYSTDISLAWTVLERCFEGGEVLQLSRDLDGGHIVHVNRWTLGVGDVRIWDDTAFEPAYKCPTAPHVICIAAAAFYLEDDGERWEYEVPELAPLRERFPELERPTRSDPKETK